MTKRVILTKNHCQVCLQRRNSVAKAGRLYPLFLAVHSWTAIPEARGSPGRDALIVLAPKAREQDSNKTSGLTSNVHQRRQHADHRSMDLLQLSAT